MVGTILSRVLSTKTRIAPKISVPEVLDEKRDFPYPSCSEMCDSQQIDQAMTTLIMMENDTVEATKEPLNLQDNTKRRSLSGITAMPTNSRKDSYASVKEDTELPQSFTSRRLSSKPIPSRSATLPKKPSLSNDGVAQSTDDRVYENAISDDDDEVAVELMSDSNSIHDSIQCPTRSRPASLDTMPDEILDLIFSLLTLDVAKDRYLDPKVDLFSCLQVSKAVHAAALRVFYQHVKFSQSKSFHKFANSLAEDAQLGDLVQCLDFSHYSTIGFGRARATNNQVAYLTPQTLRACLSRTHNLRAFLAHEHVDDELDVNVLSELFKMPSIRAIDLCSCSSTSFSEAFTAMCTGLPSVNDMSASAVFRVERLSLHECGTLRPQVFEALLPCLPRLTHLDVAHTMINDKALMSIPSTARITHLNLERCTQVTGQTVVKFLMQHPAVNNTIIYLNLMADASRYRLLSEDELSKLLPALPHSLRSLNLGGARVNSSHTPCLRQLATHLEELGLKGANLGLGADIAHLLSLTGLPGTTEMEHPEWRSSLRYIDLTDVKSVSKMSLQYSPISILGNESVPLEVIELGSSLLTDLDKSAKRQKNPEWVVRELGRRGWYVRQTSSLPKWLYTADDGYRKWKMGARWWGMRKIPIFEQDTSGMYGYFMFKRN